MSDQTSQEPTMEEILASIRRIISEDDAPPEAEAAAPEAIPLPEPEADYPNYDDDDVLELTETVDTPAPIETVGDLDVYSPPRAPEPEPFYAPEPEPAYTPPPAPVAADEPLVSAATASAAASIFGQLSATVAMPAAGRTLEDVVRELLRPLLKDWLDTHLTGIVEAKVAEEVERITRGRVG